MIDAQNHLDLVIALFLTIHQFNFYLGFEIESYTDWLPRSLVSRGACTMPQPGGAQMNGEPAFNLTLRSALACDPQLASPAGFHAGRRVTSRLLACGLIGLALAVVLWGTGYKLSLYRPHPSPSVRVGVAKLWVGPQRSACVRSKTTAQPTPDFQLLVVSKPAFSCNAEAPLDLSVAAALHVRFRLLLSTLRSPPARYL